MMAKNNIFGEGAVKELQMNFKKVLGEIPISSAVGKCGDDGKPIVGI